MACAEGAFVFEPGNRAGPLRDALPLRVRAVMNGRRSHMSPETWRAAHESNLGHAEMTFAADWLTRFAYVARATDLHEEAAFLREQLALCGSHEAGIPENPTSFVALPAFHRAAAFVRWADEGAVPLDPLRTAARIRAEGWELRGGLQRVIDEIPRHGGWQRTLALTFSADLVVHALLGDWDWVDGMQQRAFAHLDSGRTSSPDGLLVQFCTRLSKCVRQDRTPDYIDAARKALNRCAASRADSAIVGEPWDASGVLLYFCVYAFESVVNGRKPKIVDVNRALLGST